MTKEKNSIFNHSREEEKNVAGLVVVASSLCTTYRGRQNTSLYFFLSFNMTQKNRTERERYTATSMASKYCFSACAHTSLYIKRVMMHVVSIEYSQMFIWLYYEMEYIVN
jgi:hypothetical protein